MERNLIKIGLIVLAFTVVGCNSSPTKEDVALSKQISTQPPADSPEKILERAASAFSNVEGITDEKKLKLKQIYSRVYTESMGIRRAIGQSKSLLFATLAKKDFKKAEILTLKKKIVDLDQQRLNVMFVALDEVQAVVGAGVDTEKIYKHFEYYEIPGRRLTLE